MEPFSMCISALVLIAFCRSVDSKVSSVDEWKNPLNEQYHIQSDEGDERYFKYQTKSGQYRKEKRLQDGTVVGTYGWVDPNGHLRLSDYVADDQGYRIVRTKLIYVGEKATGGETRSSDILPPKPTAAPPLFADTVRPGFPSPHLSPPLLHRDALWTPRPAFQRWPYPHDDDRGFRYEEVDPYENDVSLYDGISTVQNGFRYYLPRHYHEEASLDGDRERAGSFGYIDPFGIRRVVYYNASPGKGFIHRKNNRYVGFSATPYDPRPDS